MAAEKYIPGTQRDLAPDETNRACVVDDADGRCVALLQRGNREPGLGPPPWNVGQA